MKSGTNLLFIPIAAVALYSCIRLSGFPEKIHLTPARIFLMFLTTAGCLFYILFVRKYKNKTSNKGKGAFFFQLFLFIAVISSVPFFINSVLLSRSGILYSLGAFFREAQPFLLFLMVLCLSSALFIVSEQKKTGKISFSDLIFGNTIIPETFLIFLSCLLVFGAFCPLRDNYYPSHDSAIFAYIGQQILRGKIPYTQLWDHKPPLIFYFDALGLHLGNGSLAGIWALEFILFFIGALIFLHLLKKFFSKWLSVFVLFLGMLHYVRVLDFGNYTEELSLFFVLCALWAYFSNAKEQHLTFFGFLNGFFCGLAFTSKQNTIGCWGVLFLLGIIRISHSHEEVQAVRRDFIKYWIFTAVSFIIVNAGWIIYFAAHQALEAYWDVAFRFNFIYSDRSTDSRLACAWTTLTFLPSVTPFLFLGFLSCIPACAGQIRKPAEFIAKNELTAWAILDLPIELILAGLSGMNYQHYFILCITPVIILLCYGLDSLTPRLKSYRQLILLCTCVILCVFSLPLYKFFADNYMHRTPSSYTKTRDFLLTETVPDQSILVWGSRTAIYVMSERFAPTAYFNERPLYLFPDAVQEKQWNELLSDIKRDKPQVIIYTHDTALPFISRSGSECTIPQYAADFSIPTYRFFCDNYRYDTTINPEFSDAWDIYTKK